MNLPKQVLLGKMFCDAYDKAIPIANKHMLTLDVMAVVAVKTKDVQDRDLVTACACVFKPLDEIAALDELDILPAPTYAERQSQQRTKAKRSKMRDVLIEQIRSLAKAITIITEPIAARNSRYAARMKELRGEGKTVRAASVLIHSEETAAGQAPPDAGTIKRICYK